MMKMKDFFKKLFCYIPKTAFAFALIGILAFFLHMSALLFPAVADALSESVGALLRATLACLTALFPFSLAEVLLLGLPLWIVLSVLIVRRALKKRASPIRIIALFLSFLPLLYALFVFTIGLGYATTPLAKKLELSPPSRPTSKELASTALWLAQRAEEEIPYITFDEEGKSVMPLSYGEMNRALYEAFASLKENEMPHLQNYPVGTKAVLLCRPMSYTGITGVYSFFTGEANVNAAQPDYSTVYTAAHEMAHARGISREDEANFVAFLALKSSDDPYLRYAAYTNLLQYVLNALRRIDRTSYKEVYFVLPDQIVGEYLAYNAYLDEVDDHPIRSVAESINNAYLTGVGTEGTVSYSLVTRLAVAYFKKQK